MQSLAGLTFEHQEFYFLSLECESNERYHFQGHGSLKKRRKKRNPNFEWESAECHFHGRGSLKKTRVLLSFLNASQRGVCSC